MDKININGFDVFLFYNKNKTTYINSYILSGMYNETKENTGINHLLEHILTNSWKKCLNHKCSTYWKKRGVSYNAFTYDSHLNYYTFGLKQFNDEMIEYIVSILCNPTLNDTMIENETTSIKNELLSNMSDKYYDIYCTFHKHFFLVEGLKYSNDFKEQLNHLKHFNLSLLKEYLKLYYTPNNIMFSISGDFNKSKMLNYFKSHLPKDTSQKMIIPKHIFSYSNKIIHIQDSKLDNYKIYIGFPTKLEPGDIPIDITISILNTILYEHLRTKLKLIYAIDIQKKSSYLGTYIIIRVEVNKENVKQLIHELLKTIDYYKDHLFEKDKIDAYKLNYKLNYLNSMDNTITISDFYMNQYVNKNKLIYSKEEVYKIHTQIKPKDLLNDIFNLENMLFIYKSRKPLI